MATVSEIKNRIKLECNRDDLDDTLASMLDLSVYRAIEFYADEKFYFNSIITTTTTIGGSPDVALPTTIRKVERVSMPPYWDLREVILSELGDPTIIYTGPPTGYAYYNDALRVWPVPDQAYPLVITAIANVTPVITEDEGNEWEPLAAIAQLGLNDDATNAWTNAGQDMIVARARFTLMRDQFRDPEGAQLAAGAAQEAYDRLKRETAKRLEAPLRMRADTPFYARRFNIRAGY